MADFNNEPLIFRSAQNPNTPEPLPPVAPVEASAEGAASSAVEGAAPAPTGPRKVPKPRPEDLDDLRAYPFPDRRDSFDSVFGDGAAAKALAAAPEEDKEEQGNLEAIARGAARGVLNVGKETVEFAADAANFLIGDPIRYALGKAPAPAADLDAAVRELPGGEGVAQAATIGKPERLSGQLTESLTQFVGGLVGVGKLKLAAGLAKSKDIADFSADSAAVAAVAFDPQSGNIANFAEQLFGENFITKVVAVNPNEPNYSARLKNALGDAALGVPLNYLVHASKAIYGSLKGTVKVDDVISELTRRDAAAAALEVPNAPGNGVEALPPGTAALKDGSTITFKSTTIGDATVLEAIKDGKPIGELALHSGGGTPAVEVVEGFRGNHVASALYDEATRLGHKFPALDDATGRSPVGQAFREGYEARKQTATDEAATRAKVQVEETAIQNTIVELRTRIGASTDDYRTRLALNDSLGAWDGFFRDDATVNLQRMFLNGGYESRLGVRVLDDVIQQFGIKDTGKTTIAAMKEAAEELGRIAGTEPGVVLAAMLRDGANTAELGARVIAYRNMAVNLTSDLARLSDALDAQNPSAAGFKTMDELEEAFDTRSIFAAEVIAASTQVSSNAGRTLRAQRTGAVLSAAQKEDAKIVKAVGDRAKANKRADEAAAAAGVKPKPGQSKRNSAELRELAKLMKTRYGAAERAKLAAAARKPGFYDHLSTVRINFLLSGAGTHLAAFATNAAHIVTLTTEDLVAGSIKGAQGGGWRDAQVAAHRYYQLAAQTSAAFRAARDTTLSGASVLDPKALGSTEKIIKQVSKTDIEDAIRAGDVSKAVGLGIRTTLGLPTRALMVSDEFFKQVAYRSEVASQAIVLGKSRNLSGANLKKFVDAEVDAKFNQFGEALDPGSLQRAREATFTNDFDRNGRWGKIQTGIQGNEIGRLFVPFFRSPARVIEAFARRGLPVSEVYTLFTSKNPDVRRQAVARMATGAGFYAMAWQLYDAGVITGGGPQEREGRRLYTESIGQPYSFKLGGAEFQTTRLGPFADFFNFAADMREAWAVANDTEKDDLGVMIMSSMASQLRSKNVFSGLNNALLTLQDTQGTQGDKADKIVRDLAVSFLVPVVVANSSDDPYRREAYTLHQKIMSRVGGWSEKLDPVRDFRGRPELSNLYSGQLPVKTRASVVDPVAAQLGPLVKRTGAKLERPAPRVGEIDLRTWKQPNGRSLYDRYLELHAEGKIDQTLMEAIKSKDWDDSDERRLEIVREIQLDARKEAFSALLEEYPDLEVALDAQDDSLAKKKYDPRPPGPRLFEKGGKR